jgi:hypothetical protein
MGASMGTTTLLCIYGCRIFWTPITKKHGSWTLGTDFLAHSLGRSGSFLLPLFTTMMVIEGSMLANASFLGHLSLGAMGVGFF